MVVVSRVDIISNNVGLTTLTHIFVLVMDGTLFFGGALSAYISTKSKGVVSGVPGQNFH